MDDGRKYTKIKMSGYLYLKTKKRMISSWKNYWFVLEDRLLLFYRSKAEYEAISPCKGSINLGPPCAVKSLPSVTNGFQIETRSVTYTLKAENSDEQKNWLQTLLFVLRQNQNFSTDSPKRMCHFRYSLDNLVPKNEPNDSRVLTKVPFHRQNSVPHRMKLEVKKSDEIIHRLQKMGAHSYGGSLGAITKIASKKVVSPSTSQDLSGSKGSLPSYYSREMEDDKEDDEVFVRPTRVIGDNIYERISGDSQYSDRGSFIVDNENYSIPLRKSVGVSQEDGNNTVPSTRETKSLMIENDDYQITRHVQSEEVIYAEPKIGMPDVNKNNVIVENSFYACADVSSHDSSVTNENVYEDLDKFSHYSQPVLKSTEEHCSSQTPTIPKNAKHTSVAEKKQKSKSFLRRMWKRRNKKEEGDKQQDEEAIYAEVDPTAVEKLTIVDDNAIQMLSELHNILENKKTQIKANISKNTPTNNAEENRSQTSTSTSTSEQTCPTLPPKTHKMSLDTKLNQPIKEVPSLDEILEDLDKEKFESKSKVQMLIEKFSDHENEDVVLRKHEKPDAKTYRHSDELNTLLNELAKVTSAPIMTPGVTSSLVNPNLPNEEWLKLLPVRQRRLSEPDYDVPRPHKSISLPEKPENLDAIPATRFFGPALPAALTYKKEDSLITNMTPDSLEVEDEQQKYQTEISYTSHNYYNGPPTDIQCFSHNYSPQDDKIIYAMPKSYLSVATHIVNTCQNICVPISEENTIIYKNVKKFEVQEEIFNDSLELCNETLTEL